jgi:hypothetical protein
MDTKELKGLMEAYSEVYASQEIYEEPITGALIGGALGLAAGAKGAYHAAKKTSSRSKTPIRDYAKNFAKGIVDPRTYVSKNNKANEEVDLYDIILSHLLDEGYADTEESATAIMANMSEEWRESIYEADSLADFQARREKRRAAMEKKTGYKGHDYSKPAKGGGYLDALDRERESGKKD